MTVTLNKFSISDGLSFVSSQAVHAVNRLTEFTFYILDGATTSFGRLLPDLRPTSIGDAMLQTKKIGSALFETPEGDVLVEITQDKQGRYTFLATGESLEPVIFVEGKRRTSGAVWEVKVSTYLQGIVGGSTRVDYGVSASRWRGEKFSDLKEKYSAEGLLRKKGDEVFLKLPEEPLMSFKGPQANLKAEIVLKHFYQRRKTPMEEDQSKHWDLLNRLFVGYLYFSGYALAPWVNDHVMLPHQRAQREEDKAQRIAADGYLDEHELREMAQNSSLRQRVMDMAEAQSDGGDAKLLFQLESVTFQPNGYSQTYEYDGKSYEDNHVFASDKEVHSRTACPKNGFCEEFITEKGPENLIYTQKKHGSDRIDVQKVTFTKVGEEWKLVKEEKYEESRVLRLSDRSFASTILDQSQQLAVHAAKAYLATLITHQSPNLALIASLFHLVSRTDALANAKPLPETHQIKEIKSGHIGSAMRRTTPITLLTPLPSLSVEPGSQLIYNINLQSQFQLSNQNDNLELSIQQVNGQPVPSWISMKMGDITAVSTLFFGTNANAVRLCVVGNYAYVSVISNGFNGFNGLKIIDISNVNNPVVVGFFSSTTSFDVVVKGDYAYLTTSNQLGVINVSTPSNPTLVTTLNTTGYVNMFAVGNYLYVADYGVTLKVFSISNPANPSQIGSLNLSVSRYSSCIYVSGNYAFITDNSISCYIINVQVPSSPVLITSITSSPWGFGSVLVKDNYLFTTTNIGLIIYDITTISNPVLIKAIYAYRGLTLLTLDGNYLYTSSNSDLNLQIIDITNVLKAQIIATIPAPGPVERAFLSNNNIFLANGGAGVTIYNAASRVLGGSPSAADRGLMHLNVLAQDDLNNTLVNPIAIHVGDINVAIPIPNQQVYVGNSIMFTLPAGTFEFPNANFIYSAKLVGGLPLPSCINFDPSTRTFLFTPRSGDQNTYRIQVTGDDGFEGTVASTFDLVVPDRIPVLAQPLGNQTAYTGVLFEYLVASNSFTDADNDQLIYSANLVGSKALPDWLSFDPILCRFYGTPFGRNIYQIQMNANDQNRGITSATFTITVPSSAPVLLNPIGTQMANIGTPFSFTFNSNTFYDLDGDPLTYSANALPSFLLFNAATRTFTGTPQTQDAGTYLITIHAESPFGATVSATFSLTVLSSTNYVPPVLVFAIPDLSIASGVPFNTTFSSQTFDDPQGQALTYTVTLEGGAPLPTGLYFNANTLMLSGTVATPQAMRITIKATNPYGAFAIDTFTLTAIDGTKYSPIVLNPLPDASATVGARFSMKVPDNTFRDFSGESLTITVVQASGHPLPDWLKWDAKTLSFSGMPGPFDTNTYSRREITIEVWAADSVGIAKTSFRISVGGESFWATFIKYGFGFGSIAVSAYGVSKKRALIWNYLCKDKYQKETERALVGQHYSHSLKLVPGDVKEIQVFLNGKVLPVQKPLPAGLIYKNNQLSGTPSGKLIGRFTVRVIDHHGYINEEFDLIIKNEGDPDPEKQMGHIETAKRQLSHFCINVPLKTEGDEERGRFGKMKEPLLPSQEMTTLKQNEQE